jgi:hypothetical protein
VAATDPSDLSRVAIEGSRRVPRGTADSRPAASLPAEPAWLRPVLAGLETILSLPEGWNSYRAHRVDGQAAIRAIQLLLDTAQAETPAPSVVPTAPGGVQLEWHMRAIDLEVEITPDLQVAVAYDDTATQAEWEADVTTDRQPLQEALATLTGRL